MYPFRTLMEYLLELLFSNSANYMLTGDSYIICQFVACKERSLIYRVVSLYLMSIYGRAFSLCIKGSDLWLVGRASSLCIKGSDLWLVVPIHYFVIVEAHCSDWVMRQFGLHHHIFDDVDTLDDFHIVNR